MKRFHCGCVVLLIALFAVVPGSSGKAKDNAKSLFSKGQQAEARQHYEEAFLDFKQAYDLHPENTEYRSAFERTKFLAGAEHVHQGQILRDQGKLSEALKEFQAAAMIDPSSGIALQEINRTQKLIDKAQQPAEASPTSRALQEQSKESNLAGPVQLAPISQTPLTLKLDEDSKKVYEAIGNLAGINILFDPDYVPRRIHVELNAVSLEQALRVVALESRTFWRPVTPNTIYVAQDTQQKRTEVEQQVLRTFYLNNFSTVSELQDVANLIRTILRVERVQQFPAQNVIVMRGTPDQVALAELLINNLDKAKSEVMVDVVVMQVSKMKLKQLGIQMPFQGGTTNPTITLQSPTITNQTTTTSTTSTTPTGTTTSGLTLNSLGHLTALDFAISIPPMSVAFLMQDSDTNVLQRPQLRSVDGQKATMKIGERVPIAVGTSSSTLTATALTQTQFQYQDVGVNIEMTPHIHANGDVSMKISIEVSDIDSYQTIGGLTEPVIGQRKIDHEIRMRDGDVSLIGGMMEHDDVKNFSGLPWVSQIPGLKYLFGQGQKSKTDTETVFALIPHVVRRLDLNEMNVRGVDIGTQNVVEVRHMSKAPAVIVPTASVPSGAPSTAVPDSGQTSQSATPQGAANIAPPPASGTAPQPTSQPASSMNQAVSSATQPGGLGPVLSLDPPIVNQAMGGTIAINVILNGGQNVFSVPVQIHYDPKVMRFVNVSNAGALSKDGAAVALVHRDDTDKGVLTVSLTRPPGASGISPAGPLFTLMFMAKTAGQGTVAVDHAVLRDPNNAAIDASGSQAVINVR